MEPKVYVVLTQYNQSHHAIECIESLLKNNYKNYQVILVDNASTDNSLEEVKNYLSGKVPFQANVPSSIKSCVYPIASKPLSYSIFNYNKAATQKFSLQEYIGASTPEDCFCTIIKNNHNGYFVEGNNIGMAMALQRNDAGFIWLLNNDTVIANDAVTALVNYYRSNLNKKIGIIGSKLLFYDTPEMIQAVAGNFNKYKGWPKQMGTFEIDKGQYNTMPPKVDYVIGAALFFNKQFITDVGTLNEDYVLYTEELDWCTRGALQGYETHTCLASKVYHKQGATSGSKVKNLRKPTMTTYYRYRNLLLYYKKYYPHYILFMWWRLFMQSTRKMGQGSSTEFKVFMYLKLHPPTWHHLVRFEDTGLKN